MRPLLALTPLAFPLLLAGCGGTTGPAATANTVDINAAAVQAQDSIDHYAANVAPPARPAPAADTPPLTPPAPGTPGGLPDDRTPVSEAPFTPDSAQGAADVVQTYYALLGEGKYRQAWALWGHGGKDSGLSATAFAASFARYGAYHANVGAPGEVDAGMSQRWVTVPVQVYGRLKAGAPVAMIGTVQLHRIVPGVSADPMETLWRIRSIDVKPRPTG